MNTLLVLPLLIPVTAAIVSLLAWNSRRAQRVLGVTGTALLFASGLVLLESVRRNGIQASQMNAWPAPFGITLVADLFSAIMVAIAGFMGFAVAVYSLATMDRQREAFANGGFHPRTVTHQAHLARSESAVESARDGLQAAVHHPAYHDVPWLHLAASACEEHGHPQRTGGRLIRIDH